MCACDLNPRSPGVRRAVHCSERLHFAPRGTGSAQASSGNPFLPLLSSCAPGAEATALCALEGAGAWALGLSGAALLAGLLLGAATATQEVHKRGKLGSLVECLTIPAANFERAMLLAPPLLWGLLLLFVFLTLLVYAARVSPVLPAAVLPCSLPLLPSRPHRRAGALRRARHGAPRPLVRLRPPRAAARCGGRGAACRLPARRRPGRGEAWLRLKLIGAGSGAGAGSGLAEPNPSPPARTASPRTK